MCLSLIAEVGMLYPRLSPITHVDFEWPSLVKAIETAGCMSRLTSSLNH